MAPQTAVPPVKPAAPARLLPLLAAALLAVLPACDGGTEPVVKPPPPPGATRQFNVNSSSACGAGTLVTFKQVAEGTRAIVYEDTRNPAGGFTAADYASVASTFDNLVWPVDTRAFGEPRDIDGNGKVAILYTRAVNELTTAGSTSFVGGFFFGRDLFPKQASTLGGVRFGSDAACAGSNVGELFYMLAPDPNGEVNTNKRSREFVLNTTFTTLGHEFQHLINASRRIFVNDASSFEETWLDEGLAHIAEELLFYQASGLTPRLNIDETTIRSSAARVDAFNTYQGSNYGRLEDHLENAETSSPYDDDDDLATRGGAWSLVRYGIDQAGGDANARLFALVNSKASGLANFGAALGLAPAPLVRAWNVGLLADDAVAGLPVLYTHPSWNYRSVFGALGRTTYPLKTTMLVAGVPSSALVRAGSASFYRLAVPAGVRSGLRVAVAGGGPAGSCDATAPLALAVGEVRALAAGPAFACLEGGAEYGVVPVYSSTVQEETIDVSVSATVATPPATNIIRNALSAGGLRLSTARTGEPTPDRAFEARLRALERRELGPRLRGGAAPRFARASSGPADVVVHVVRTK